jgi:hypothetical protein
MQYAFPLPCPRRSGRILSESDIEGASRLRSVHTSNEESVASEHCSVIAIFQVVANTVLRVARRVKSLDSDTRTYLECLSMLRCLRHALAVFTADNG